jgi:hypothetical protein
VLDQAFHQADVAPIVERNFQVVHVWTLARMARRTTI